MKEVTREQFFKDLMPGVQVLVEENIEKYNPSHLVLFMNSQMDSSSFGCSTVAVVGPHCTWKTLEDVEGKWLYDLPSQRQYPESYCIIREVKHARSNVGAEKQG